MRELLSSENEISIYFVVSDGGDLEVEIQSTPTGPDLSVPDEVIVVVNGEGFEVVAENAESASAKLGNETDYEGKPFELMIRVHDYFEGWEFNEDSEGE